MKTDPKDTLRDAAIVGATAVGISEAVNLSDKITSSAGLTFLALVVTNTMTFLAVSQNNEFVAFATGLHLLLLLILSPMCLLVLFVGCVATSTDANSPINAFHIAGAGFVAILLEGYKAHYLRLDFIRSSILASSQVLSLLLIFKWEALSSVLGL